MIFPSWLSCIQLPSAHTSSWIVNLAKTKSKNHPPKSASPQACTEVDKASAKKAATEAASHLFCHVFLQALTSWKPTFWISIDEVFEEGHDVLQGSRQASPESEFKHFSLQHLVWALAVTYHKADCATCFQFTNSEHGLELPSAVLGIGHGSVLERLHSGCFWSNRESSQLKRIVMSTGDVRKKHTLNFIRLALTTSELRNCRSPFSLFRSKSFFIQNSIQVPGV